MNGPLLHPTKQVLDVIGHLLAPHFPICRVTVLTGPYRRSVVNERIAMGLSRPSIAGFYSDPEIVSLTGWAVTSEDIRLFDNKWMTQEEHVLYISVVHNAFWVAYDQFGIPFESVVW